MTNATLKTNVWQTNEMQENGKFKFIYHTIEPKRWIYAYSVPDPEKFINHMELYNAIPYKAFSRDEYEMLCAKYDVSPIADKEIFPSYGLEYGDFGMSHYHAIPENREMGISSTLNQRRLWEIKREKTECQIQPSTQELIETGQLWEPCPKCGKEPIYMPSHLCESCSK